MNETLIVFIVIGLPVVCLTVLFLTKMIIVQGNRKKETNRDGDEAIIEEIYHGLRDLRSRVENLETILHNQYRQ